MLKPVEMQKIRIIVLKSVINELIRRLHELGVLEINVVKHPGLEQGKPLEYFNTVSEQLVRIRAIKNTFSIKEAGAKTADKKIPGKKALNYENPYDAISDAGNICIDEELKKLSDEQNKVESDLTRQKEDLKLVEKLGGFSDIDFSRLETKNITYTFGFLAGGHEKIVLLKEKLDRVLPFYDLRYSVAGNETFVLIIHKSQDKQLDLSESGFNKILLPKTVSSPSKAKDNLLYEIKNRERRLKEIKNEVMAISDKYYDRIACLENALSIEADRTEIASRFNFTNTAAIIEGWIKAEDFKNLESEIAKFHGKAFMEKVEAGQHNGHEAPPVLLSNPKIALPIQFITQNYSLPSYSEIDPTMIYLFTIPLIYGMIVGDVFYGIISLFIAAFFMKKFASSYIMSNVSRIWYYSAFPSIIFGIIFDEWLGMSHYNLLKMFQKWGFVDLASFGIRGPLYKGISRVEELPLVIGISVITGLIHIALGFILGAINEWNHSKKHALAKISWLFVEIGGAVAVSSFLLHMASADIGNIGVYIFVISVISLALTEGIIGVIELPSLLGNILSYARIAAVGVVGVILAEIINKFLMPLPEQGLLAFLLFPLFIIMHAVNAFIAMFESLIHGGRLNILEFKMKFLKGGGKPFEPFAVYVK